MKYFILSLGLILICACSGGSGESDNGIEIIPLDRDYEPMEKEIPVSTFEYIDIESIHNIKVFSDERSLFEQSNFTDNRSLLYEYVLKNYINYDDFSFFKGIHHHLLRQFGEKEKLIRYSGESCSLRMNARFSIPARYQNKILSDSVKMNFVVQLSNKKDVVIPAVFTNEKSLIENGTEYSIRSVEELDKTDCHSMITQRGRLTLEIEAIELGDGRNYFVTLEEQLQGKKLYGVLDQNKERYFTVPENIGEEILQEKKKLPRIEEDNWHVLYGQIAKIFFNATIDQIEKSDGRWKRAVGKIDRKKVLSFESSVNEMVVYLHGYKSDPQVKLEQGVEFKQAPDYFPLTKDYSKIITAPTICHLYYKKIEMKSKLLSSINAWREVPIVIDGEGLIGSLWELPGFETRMVGESLAIDFDTALLSRTSVMINFHTYLGQKKIDITPDLPQNAPARCRNDFNNRGQVIKNVNITSEYTYEIYFR